MSADPHAFRGAHPADGGVVIRTVRPAAKSVTVYVNVASPENPAGAW